MEPKLHRYAISSLSRVLKPVVEGENYAFWIEGVSFDQSSVLKQDNSVLRVIGPWYYMGSGKDRYKLEVTVLTTDLLDHSSSAYELSETVGAIAAALSNPIPVARWGDGDASIGCLDIDPDAKEHLRIVDHGVIDKDTRVKQASVIAKFQIEIDN